MILVSRFVMDGWMDEGKELNGKVVLAPLFSNAKSKSKRWKDLLVRYLWCGYENEKVKVEVGD